LQPRPYRSAAQSEKTSLDPADPRTLPRPIVLTSDLYVLNGTDVIAVAEEHGYERVHALVLRSANWEQADAGERARLRELGRRLEAVTGHK